MAENKDVTVNMPTDLLADIEDQLSYGDSRSEWIREACRQRLARESDEGNAKSQEATAD